VPHETKTTLSTREGEEEGDKEAERKSQGVRERGRARERQREFAHELILQDLLLDKTLPSLFPFIFPLPAFSRVSALAACHQTTPRTPVMRELPLVLPLCLWGIAHSSLQKCHQVRSA